MLLALRLLHVFHRVEQRLPVTEFRRPGSRVTSQGVKRLTSTLPARLSPWTPESHTSTASLVGQMTSFPWHIQAWRSLVHPIHLSDSLPTDGTGELGIMSERM